MIGLKRTLLIVYPGQYVVEEARALAEAAGYDPVAFVSQKYLARAKFGIGAGKAEEVSRLAREKDVEVIIFDSRLNASQMYNLEMLCNV